LELLDVVPSHPDALGRRRSGGQEDQGIEDVLVESGRALQRAMALFDGSRQAAAEVGLEPTLAFEVSEGEGDVTRLVVPPPPLRS